MRWKDAKLYSIKPAKKHKRKTKSDYARSHRAEQHKKQREHRALRYDAIRLLLGLRSNAMISPEQIEQAETKLGLGPSDLSFNHRLSRIYRALQKRA